ncbi:hypothetical protein T265_03310 [Opisthorchis viverrini]|uniref:Uncharacterized protein n=1 Tax=Opisthorchis viverrini TaxID=6198 RepID=A0A075A3X5_OPIVI|nr:hypothetical protein T265_03310 [Opisthorchis viverrini]KER30260.1 hypothetical protein T265_03310 [Opisthorchis viverrini]
MWDTERSIARVSRHPKLDIRAPSDAYLCAKPHPTRLKIGPRADDIEKMIDLLCREGIRIDFRNSTELVKLNLARSQHEMPAT